MEPNSMLVSIIWFYETLRQSGTVIAPLIPIIAQTLNIRIGDWKIDKLNIANLVMAFAYFILLFICQMKVYDISKIYDQQFGHRLDSSDKKGDFLKKQTLLKKEGKVMKWENLFKIDILSIVILVSLSRYASTICNLVVIAAKFSWSGDKVYPLTLASSIVFIVLLSIMNMLQVFNRGRQNIFFIFIMCLILMAGNITSVLLTSTGVFINYDSQLIYLAILRLAQSFAWFQTNTLGSFLLFHLVDPKDSSFVAGFRGMMSSLIKSIAQGLVFTTVYHPEYYVPWIAFGLLTFSWLILCRRSKYLN